MADYREVELKLYAPDLGAVEQRLLAAGAHLEAPRVFERNVRYDNRSNNLTSKGVVLRLREDTRVRLTYKDDSEGSGSGGIRSRFEAEVEVSDFDAMHTILVKLGYVPYMTYEKYRTTYRLEGCEVTLDEMPYGNFVEIEGEAAAIERMVRTLGLSDSKRYGTSYVGLFEIVKHNLGLSFRDLTFEQFEGVDVPESAFKPSPPAPLPQGEGGIKRKMPLSSLWRGVGVRFRSGSPSSSAHWDYSIPICLARWCWRRLACITCCSYARTAAGSSSPRFWRSSARRFCPG